MTKPPTFYYKSTHDTDKFKPIGKTGFVIMGVLTCVAFVGWSIVGLHELLQGNTDIFGYGDIILGSTALYVAVLLFKTLSSTAERLDADGSGLRYKQGETTTELSYGDITDVRATGTPYMQSPRLIVTGPGANIKVSATWPNVDILVHLLHTGLDKAGNLNSSTRNQLLRFYRNAWLVSRIHQKKQKLVIPAFMGAIVFWASVVLLAGIQLTIPVSVLMFATILLPMSGMYVGEWLCFRQQRDQIEPTKEAFPKPDSSALTQNMIIGYSLNMAVIAVVLVGLLAAGF